MVGLLRRALGPREAGLVATPNLSRASAEREGFEPSMELVTPYSLSRRVPSATRPPLRGPWQCRPCPRARPAARSAAGSAAPGLASASGSVLDLAEIVSKIDHSLAWRGGR